MKDLFGFLFRIRNTLLFAALMVFAFMWSVNRNSHHRAVASGAAGDLFGTIYGWRNAVTSFAQLKVVNEQLLEENARLRQRHRSAYVPVDDRVVRIQDTLHAQQFLFRPAHIVNSTTHKQKNHLMLDRGSLAGITRDMGVLGPNGIVGVIDRVGPHFSVAISVLDVDLSTSVELARTGHFGLLRWDTNDPLFASLHDIAKHAPVMVNDTVVTRGGDGIFPRNIPVGVVVEVRDDPASNYHRILVRLAEDLTRTGTVHIVSDVLRLERDTLTSNTSE